ncbi:MAG: hypothetical protein FJ062_02450 [Cyanobacteria bacterium M_DeepCast_100m_m1_067]|nr:hypothetical protein [Cyanobacteria bacterium M_DeepCast_100m_m1_067]
MTGPTCSTATATAASALHQGACVQLGSDEQLYQVIGIDDHHDRCWLRRWPLSRQGSEVFEISLQQVRPARPHRS